VSSRDLGPQIDRTIVAAAPAEGDREMLYQPLPDVERFVAKLDVFVASKADAGEQRIGGDRQRHRTRHIALAGGSDELVHHRDHFAGVL
jgi:hypothetical protein